MKILKFNVDGVETYIYSNSIIKYEALEDAWTRIYCSPGTKDPYQNDIYELNIETEHLLKIIHEDDYPEGLDEMLIDIENENGKPTPAEETPQEMRGFFRGVGLGHAVPSDAETDALQDPVAELELSVRAKKVLKSYKIETVGNLIEFDAERITAKEIKKEILEMIEQCRKKYKNKE